MKKNYIAPLSSSYSVMSEGMMAMSIKVDSSSDEKITDNSQFLSNKNQGGPWANMNNED